MKTSKLFIFKPLTLFVLTIFATLLFSVNASAYSVGYSSRLPDDSYRLRLPNGNQANSDGLDCYISSNTHGDCTAYGYGSGGSHQYITLSTGQINDSTRDADYVGANYSYFSIITDSKTAKGLSVDLVERAITDLGCSGFSLTFDYYNPVTPNDSKRTSVIDIPAARPGDVSKCKRYSVPQNFPSTGFAPIYENGKPTGYFKGFIRIKIDGSGNRQASFHLNTEGSARLGYAGTEDGVGNLNADNEYEDTLSNRASATYAGWINTYPTNAADDHRIVYSFRPPCSIAQGSTFDIGWDSLDWPTSFQPGRPTVQLIKHGRGGVDDNPIVVANYGNVSTQDSAQTRTITMTASMYRGAPSDKNPYSFSLVVDGIRGGNGVSFYQPFDSAYAQMNCPDPSPSWDLRNNTDISGSAAGYNNANDGVANRQNRAVSFFQSYRFTHSVWNLPGHGRSASNADSEVQAFVRRGDKPDDSFSAVFTPALATPGNPSTMGNRLNSGTSTDCQADNCQRISRVASNSQLRMDHPPLSGDDYSLYPPGRNPVARGAWCATRTVSAANPNPAPPASPSHCTVADGAAWRYDRGDMYCEKVITRNFNSTLPGQTLNRPNPGGAYAPDIIKCVELSTNPGPCFSDPWSINSVRSNIRERDPTDWSETGLKSYNDARVGITYDTWYIVDKYGAADSTGNITGHFTKVDHDGATLGSWIDDGPNDVFALPENGNSAKGFAKRQLLIGARDGGKTFYSHANFSPSSGDANCNTSGSIDDQTSIYVPYYFNITPSIGSIAPATEQGQDINMSASYNLPVDDGAGRQHTWTDDTQYKITELINPTSQTVLGDNSNGDVCGQYTHGGCREVTGDRDHIEPGSGSLGTMGRSGADTASLPVGTNVCYLASLNRPTHNADPSWRHTGMVCTKIIKKPKVQFRGGDLTVGRYRKDGDNCTRAPLSGAVIQASGASSANPYGSWIEYGAFATGNITGFGSGAFPYGNTGDNYKRLLFANTTSTPGNYVYGSGSKCLSDPFTVINSNYNTIDDETIRPGDYFAANTNDKEGYVREGDLTLGEPAAEAGGGGAGTDTASTGAQYVVQHCYGETNTVPSGWSATGGGGSSMSRSSGCNGDGGNHRLRVYWEQDSLADSGANIGWRYSAPSGAELINVRADRSRTLGVSWHYSDPFAVTGTNSCTRYFEGAGVDGTCTASRVDSIDQNLSGTTFDFNIYCSVNLVTGENGGKCNSGGTPTSLGLSNIRITMKDTTSPSVTVDGGSLKGSKVSGKDARLTITGTDTGSGIYGYTLKAYGPGLPAAGKVLKEEKFDSEATCIASPVTTPTPCSSTKTKEMSVDTTQSGFVSFGVYTFTVQTRDQAGNTSAVRSWDTTVDNRQLLGADYNAFKNRNVVIWARKDGDKACGESGAGGNININTDIIYKIDGYSNISELPRIIFMADCDIVIDDAVQTVSAWLVAKKDIYTCSRTIANYFSPENTDTSHPNQADCNKQLTINGAIQANRLHLLRTYGSDQTTAEKGEPAETFNLRADQVLSTWAKGQTSGSPRTIYQSDDNPNF